MCDGGEVTGVWYVQRPMRSLLPRVRCALERLRRTSLPDWDMRTIGSILHGRPRPPSHIRSTYFSRTAWTSIPEEFHLQEGASESERGARRGR